MANTFEPHFDTDQDRPGFTYRRARLGRQAGAERLGASLYDVPPGQATFPYHFHFANEELLLVLRGRPHLRTPGGWRQLEEGEVVAFPVGERGAHQLQNRTDHPVRFLMISEMAAPELNVYPDTGKLGAMSRPPGSPEDPGAVSGFFHRSNSVDYWDGEEPPDSPSER